MILNYQNNNVFLWLSDHESFYHGRVFGELQSEASVHMEEEEGAMTATIHLPDESYHIEVTWKTMKFVDMSCLKKSKILIFF